MFEDIINSKKTTSSKKEKLTIRLVDQDGKLVDIYEIEVSKEFLDKNGIEFDENGNLIDESKIISNQDVVRGILDKINENKLKDKGVQHGK